MRIHINEIKEYLSAENLCYIYYGKNDLEIEGFCALSEPKSNSITWIKKMDNINLLNIDVSLDLLIVTDKKPDYNHDSYNLIISDNPKTIFFDILNSFYYKKQEAIIASTAVIETTKIGKNVSIGHHCYICADVTIGENVEIKHNVIIDCPAIIGNDCIIDSGVIIGSLGNGYYRKDGSLKDVPDFGGVVIGDRVKIGANSCVARGTITDTIINDDVIIDALCEIAHNVKIGARCFIVGGSIICGSCTIEPDVFIAARTVIKNQLTIGENSFVAIGSVVIKSVKPNQLIAGKTAKIVKDGLRLIQRVV